MSMQISDNGISFVERHEGFVSRTYLDPVGIPTIGFGFTNRSAAVRRHLGKVTPGLTLTKAKARKVLKAVIEEEFAAAARRGMINPQQHEFDMGCSGSFNCGPRIFQWNWCKYFNKGDKKKAADKWRVTAVTGGGKRLPGLVRRRQEEADLLLYGDYGLSSMPRFVETPKTSSNDELIEYQKKLKKLGYDPGKIDGWMGKNTKAAVLAFQESDPHLKNDGVLSRATMQSIDRKLENKKTGNSVGLMSSAAATGSFLSYLSGMNNIIIYIVLGVVLLVGAYLFIKYRHKIEDKFLALLD